MTPFEWSVVILLGAILGVLIVQSTYVRFIWDMQQKQWDYMWAKEWVTDAEAIQKLHLGNPSRGQQGLRPGDVYRSGGRDIPTRR